MTTNLRQWLRDLPVKRKLMLMVLTTSAVILLLACVCLFLLQLQLFKRTFARDLRALAEVGAANCTGPVSFGDKKAAEEVLSSLKNRPQVVAVSIHLADGVRWVHLGATNAPALNPSSADNQPASFDGRNCSVSQPIRDGAEMLGTLYLRADFAATYRDLLGYYSTILAGVLAGSFLVAVLLSARLQRFISGPIQQLADVARTIAVNKDYSVRAPSAGRDEIGQLTGAFNDMVSQIQARDMALERSRQRFEVAVTGSSDGLWDWDLGADSIYFSPRWKSMLGWADHELSNELQTYRDLIHPEDAARVLAAGQAYLDGKTDAYGVEFRMRHQDGSYRWILSRGAALRLASGQAIRFSGSHTDITQRKEAEAELARLNKELVDTSRQAGMAEVATGVLHNVGNVLNSVNVAVSVVTDRLRASKISSLVKAVGLLREHRADLGEFITRDPKGSQFPGFIATLSEHLVAEQQLLLEKMQALQKNVDHIKDIVAMQQSYARLAGVIETLPPASLVEDALRINAGPLEEHRIEIVREFADVSPIGLDKHKALQILVNLISNAKDAMRELAGPKRLSLRISQTTSKTVRIQVGDSGVGIAPENLVRIFQHGFTTKRTGHGFGLHSGGNAAKEMGGSLSVHSDGPGRGATFTLELPLTPAKPLPQAA